MKKAPLIISAATFFSSAIAIYLYLRFFSLIDFSLPTILFLAFTATAPLTIGLAWLMRRRFTIILAKIHAAFYFVFVLAYTMAFNPGHASPGDFTAMLDLIILFIILSIELALLILIIFRQYRSSGKAGPKWLFTNLVISSILGIYCAFSIWSAALPAQIVKLAETEAVNQPYCIEVAGEPAKKLSDLNAKTMYAGNHGGYTLSFHGLLVIGELTNRTYMNWSYSNNNFDLLSKYARDSMFLDTTIKCKPQAHFALGLH